MKKFSVIFVAVVFALSLAVPAMAIHFGSLGTEAGPAPDEGFSITGAYTFDGERLETNEATQVKRDFYDDDLAVTIQVNKGDVTALLDLELVDQIVEGHTNNKPNIVDNYWITWNATDELTFKAGEWAVVFGSKNGIYNEGGAGFGFTYKLDQADLGVVIHQQTDDEDNDTQDDITDIILTANLKGIDTVSKLKFYYQLEQDTITDNSDRSYLGLDAAIDIGGVDVAVEYGRVSDDATASLDGGAFYIVNVGLDELVGFDLNVNYYNSNTEWAPMSPTDDYSPLKIYGDNVEGTLSDVTMIWLTGSYAYNDKLKVMANVLAQGTVGSGAADGIGTEFDIGGSYALASNVSYQAWYSSFSPGDYFDASGDNNNYTELFHRIKLKF